MYELNALIKWEIKIFANIGCKVERKRYLLKSNLKRSRLLYTEKLREKRGTSEEAKNGLPETGCR